MKRCDTAGSGEEMRHVLGQKEDGKFGNVFPTQVRADPVDFPLLGTTAESSTPSLPGRFLLLSIYSEC